MTDMLPQFPQVFVDDITAGQIRQGRDFRGSPFNVSAAAHVKAVSHDGRPASRLGRRFCRIFIIRLWC